MPAFEYRRTIRFHETDGAGVLYFANGLVLCHEAYEASLSAAGIDLKGFFPAGNLQAIERAYPIVHASLDFFRPLSCGDEVAIRVTPRQLDESTFEIEYGLYLPTREKPAAQALTRHVCILAEQRTRTALPVDVLTWLREFGTAL